jgi:hypothetical protein
MEINLTEEDAKIEIIKGNKALCYKVKNNGKNINLNYNAFFLKINFT